MSKNKKNDLTVKAVKKEKNEREYLMFLYDFAKGRVEAIREMNVEDNVALMSSNCEELQEKIELALSRQTGVEELCQLIEDFGKEVVETELSIASSYTIQGGRLDERLKAIRELSVFMPKDISPCKLEFGLLCARLYVYYENKQAQKMEQARFNDGRQIEYKNGCGDQVTQVLEKALTTEHPVKVSS